MRVFGDGTIFVFQPTLTISAGSGGYVSPSGTHRFTYGHNVTACAYPDDHWRFSRWLLDGQHYSYDQCVNVYMDDNHHLQAIFEQIYHDVSTGSAYFHNGRFYQIEVPFYIDGQEVGPTGNTYQVSPGYHTFAVPGVAYAWPGGSGGVGGAIVFLCWYWVGSDNPIPA